MLKGEGTWKVVGGCVDGEKEGKGCGRGGEVEEKGERRGREDCVDGVERGGISDTWVNGRSLRRGNDRGSLEKSALGYDYLPDLLKKK